MKNLLYLVKNKKEKPKDLLIIANMFYQSLYSTFWQTSD